MPLTTSQRPPRELLRLLVAFAIVGAVCLPMWNWAGRPGADDEFLAKWTPERISRLVLGPEQILCYACMAWAGLIILGRFGEIARQRRAFWHDLLPTDEGA